MSYSQVNSSNSHEGELKGALFAGDHTPDGVFSSLKGQALTPPELSFDVQDHNDGPDRLNQEVSGGSNWENALVESGQFSPFALTRGTDKHMPK